MTRKNFTAELPDDHVKAVKRARQCRSNISEHVLKVEAPLRKPMHPISRAGARVQSKSRRK